MHDEVLSIGGRAAPGFGLGLNPATWTAHDLRLVPCARVSFQANGPSSVGAEPDLTSLKGYWTDVSVSVLNGVADVTATYIGAPQAMPQEFPDVSNGYGAPWTLQSLTITPPNAGTIWNGHACVQPIDIPIPAPAGGVNTSKPLPTGGSKTGTAAPISVPMPTSLYVATGAVILAIGGLVWAVVKS
jgi:hypothetical protein